MNTQMNLQRIAVEKIKPAKYNPRKDLKPGDPAYEKIKRSMTEFGYVDPVIWNEVSGNIVGGHQRFKVLLNEGATEIDCVVVHIESPSDEKALNIALNKAVGEWEPVALADLLADLQTSGYDLGATGFDAAEVDDLFSKVHDKDVKDDDFDIDEVLEKPHFSMPGDVWHLGRHRVFCGDSTLPESYAVLLEGERVNMVLTDPPYLVSYKGAAGTIKNDDLPDAEGYEFLLKAMKCMNENMAQDASIYLFHADSKGLIFRRAYDDAGFYLSSCCIWKKNSLVLGRSPYQWITESILYGWKKGGVHKWYAGRSETNCWEFPKPKKNAAHPTAKPIPLMAYPIKNSSLTNSIILDPFLGSGATLVACEETERVCRGIELDSKYMDVIVRRYVQYHNGDWGDVHCVRNGEKLTLEEVVQRMDEPVNMDDFVSGMDGASADLSKSARSNCGGANGQSQP